MKKKTININSDINKLNKKRTSKYINHNNNLIKPPFKKRRLHSNSNKNDEIIQLSSDEDTDDIKKIEEIKKNNIKIKKYLSH